MNLMPKQSKKPADLNRLAAAIVGDATDEDRGEPSSRSEPRGHQGGHGRAVALTPERRSEIARKAARSRWDKSAPE